MLKLNCHIEIGVFKFDYCVDVTIESSIENLTETCVIKTPRKLQWQGKNIADLISRKDRVVVQLGYDGVLKTEFTGYVRDIKSATPFEVICEDEMFILKQTIVSRPNTKTTLKELLTEILPTGITFKAVDVSLGVFRITKAPISKVLDKLKSDYGLYSYFKNGVLCVGLAYWVDNRIEENFKYKLNIIESDLQFRKAEDIKIKVRAIGIKKDNTRIEVEVGDADGDLRTLHYYEVDKTDLTKYANEKIERLKYTGFSGSFKTFGEPSVTKGDVATIIDPDYSDERNGSYLIKSVTKTFGVSIGYKQVINIEAKI